MAAGTSLFDSGDCSLWEAALAAYSNVLKKKAAEKKSSKSKANELLELDDWYVVFVFVFVFLFFLLLVLAITICARKYTVPVNNFYFTVRCRICAWCNIKVFYNFGGAKVQGEETLPPIHFKDGCVPWSKRN